uniref:dTDP-4-dehydrorhamnose 3,5-epimerase family protein n=1 Tax=Sulfurihydrogenibium sp. TaxID=2053621 RepID=UPI002636C852
VKCIKGKIFDVAVDIRRGSPTYGKWIGIELSEENKLMLWIPKGFAHGFLTLSSEAEIIYKISGAEYSPQHDRSIRWNDPEINITWPTTEEPILSEKDKNAPLLRDAEINFIY